jgi:hypothetical protein
MTVYRDIIQEWQAKVAVHLKIDDLILNALLFADNLAILTNNENQIQVVDEFTLT